MKFKFSDEHIESYHRHGYTVFRGIVPGPLIRDMRRESDKAFDLAQGKLTPEQKKAGHQVQRLQPIRNYKIDRRPFEEFGNLPELKDAVARLLTPRHQFPTEEYLGILLQPASKPYCTNWHRDWHYKYGWAAKRAGFLENWERSYRDLNLFNQVNCALYEDSCTWVVPGSHARRDLPCEDAWYKDHENAPEVIAMEPVQAEETCLDYCLAMPGAQRLLLNPGDLALYRNVLWHIGNYVPYRKRATLHDLVDTPEFAAWRAEMMKPA